MLRLKEIFSKNLLPFLGFLAMGILLVLYYRIETYFLIRETHPEFSTLKFFHYLGISFQQDGLWILFFSGVYWVLLFFLHSFQKIKYLLAGFFLMVLGFFMVLSVQFFKVYETSFQKSFMAKENLTGIKSVLISINAELTFGFWIKIVLFMILIFAGSIFIKRIASQKRKVHSHYFWGLGLALFFVILGLFFHPKPAAGLMKEFSLNPAFHFIFDQETQQPTEKIEFTGNSERLGREFLTNSLENPVRQPRINFIPRGKKYNIIFYFFESTSYQYLKMKMKGKFVMENWNKLEKNSLHFKNHYANYPLSANAMFSVLSGIHDSNEKDPVLSLHPNIKVKTILEILKEQGYRNYFIHTGFLEYAGQINFLKHRKFDRLLEYKQLIKDPEWGGYEVGWGADERVMTKYIVKMIQEDRSKPFFMAVVPVNPHHPYAIPDSSFQITGEIPSNISQKEKNWLNYINSLHYADAALGELVDALEKQGLLDNTLIFLFADHGEAFYQHPMNYNHPFFLYEENVHVPFLIYSKEFFKETKYYDGVTRHIDLLPTILDLLNLPKPKEVQGSSVFSAREEQFAFLHASWKDDFNAIRDGKWKYIHKTLLDTGELYNLEQDPKEKENLSQKFPEIAQKYRQRIFDLKKNKFDFYRQILKQ